MKRFKDIHPGNKFEIAGVVHICIHQVIAVINGGDQRKYNAVVLNTGDPVHIIPDQEVEPTLIFSKGNFNDRI